jgi:hypothetical protein
MAHHKADIVRLANTYGPRMRIRVSLDDFRPKIHGAERGEETFSRTIEGLVWPSRAGVEAEVAVRALSGDSDAVLRQGYAALFADRGIRIDCNDHQALVLLPEMGPRADPPEITETCRGILGKSPENAMCSNARMVVKRKGAAAPVYSLARSYLTILGSSQARRLQRRAVLFP